MKEILSISNKGSIKDHDFMIFELLVIEMCNLHCSYCYMRNDSPTWENFSTKKNVMDVIYKLEELSKYQKISICLSGGEASLHPNFKEFCDYVSSTDMDLHINTNLTLSKDKILNALKNKDVKFHISYHSDADMEDFKEKLLMIPQHNQELNIMMDPRKSMKSKMEEIIEFCSKNNILFNLKPIFVKDKFKPSPYVLEMMYHKDQNKEYIDDEGNYYSDYDLHKNDMLPMDTFGWECYYIFYTINCKNGDIKQMCSLFEPLNIFKDFDFFKDYKLDEPQICPFEKKCLWASSIDHYKVKK